jgi:hypothetical protein
MRRPQALNLGILSFIYLKVILIKMKIILALLMSSVYGLDIKPEVKVPIVEGLSYTEIYNLWKGYIDIYYYVSADLFAGYETNLF